VSGFSRPHRTRGALALRITLCASKRLTAESSQHHRRIADKLFPFTISQTTIAEHARPSEPGINGNVPDPNEAVGPRYQQLSVGGECDACFAAQKQHEDGSQTSSIKRDVTLDITEA
jgi:hypothetical protein